jgi:hypothetical protein
MTSAQRAQEIVSAILDLCGIDVGRTRSQLEALVIGHLHEVERLSAEKAVGVYRAKTAEATDKVLAEIAIGAPVT